MLCFAVSLHCTWCIANYWHIAIHQHNKLEGWLEWGMYERGCCYYHYDYISQQTKSDAFLDRFSNEYRLKKKIYCEYCIRINCQYCDILIRWYIVAALVCFLWTIAKLKGTFTWLTAQQRTLVPVWFLLVFKMAVEHPYKEEAWDMSNTINDPGWKLLLNDASENSHMQCLIEKLAKSSLK